MQVQDKQFIKDVYAAYGYEPETHMLDRDIYYSTNYAHYGYLSNICIQVEGSQPKLTVIYDPHASCDGALFVRMYGSYDYKHFKDFLGSLLPRSAARVRNTAIKKAVVEFIARHNIQEVV